MMTILILLLFLISCGGQEITIKSTPSDADIFIKVLGEKEEERIGKTPLTLSAETVKKLGDPAKSLTVIDVRRAGYIHEQLLINDFGNTVVEYNFTLEPNAIANIIDKIDNVGEKLFEAQRLMRAGGYEESITILKELDKKFPYSSLINELIGGAYYLKKEFKTSLLHYDLAYKYNPSNVDSFKMIRFLEKELKVSRPALEKQQGNKQ
tara:strand:- start:913 stop:1536 length:624 start_codon:yes stop_codon:yes gene_type:complete